MRDKIIRIHWSKPQRIEDMISSPLSHGPGLYYLTRLFGAKETSLYIGKASIAISSRLNAHSKWVHEYRGTILVRVGQISYPRYPDGEIIDHAESALIFEHQNILIENTDKRYSYSYSDLYRIENTGDYFQLSPIVQMKKH